MIKIVNISEEYSRVGKQKYQVYLNDIPLCQFEHNSEDGMSKCLELAAKRMNNVDVDEKIKELNLIKLNAITGYDTKILEKILYES